MITMTLRPLQSERYTIKADIEGQISIQDNEHQYTRIVRLQGFDQQNEYGRLCGPFELLIYEIKFPECIKEYRGYLALIFNCSSQSKRSTTPLHTGKIKTLLMLMEARLDLTHMRPNFPPTGTHPSPRSASV